MHPSTISGINRLPPQEKQAIFARLIPTELIDHFQIPPDWQDESGNKLLEIKGRDGSSAAEMELRHIHDFPDPILYGHITDTINGQIHVLLYILNDPVSPRFNVDRLPDGTPTQFGTMHRNLEAELAAMQYGLAPGQVRQGLRMLKPAIHAFEDFVSSLGHDLFFAEPLYYHNAVLFEKYGFAYSKGRKLMERIQAGFTPGGELLEKLGSASPFRAPSAARSIRMRSWAIHDGILGEPFTNVTMYKRIGKSAEVSTCDGCAW